MKTFLLVVLAALAGPPDWLDSVLYFCGASHEEDIPEEYLERFSELQAHPIDLNSASRSMLVESGMLSAYQAASILDYIDREGDILSISELSCVDGIGERLATAMSPFIVLRPHRAIGSHYKERVRADGLARATSASGKETSLSGKLALSYGQRLDTRISYKDGAFKAGAINWHLRRRPVKIVAGDFNVRWGQGLLVWSSMTMSGFSGTASFFRNPSGIGGTNSFSGGRFRGAGAEADFGRLTVSGFASIDGFAGANLFYLSRSGQCSVSVAGDGRSAAGVSADGRWTLAQGLYAVCELAYDAVAESPAALSGLHWSPRYGSNYSLLARAYPSTYAFPLAGAARAASKVGDEMGIALGAQWKRASLAFDWAIHPAKASEQLKMTAAFSPSYKVGFAEIKPSLRTSIRYRPADKFPLRQDYRADLALAIGRFATCLRANMVSNEASSFLSYLELGWKDGSFRAYTRATIFRADKWNDRIYAYERDVPQSFSVPAFYGRGWKASLLLGWKGFYLRAATTQYPWMEGKASKHELKVEYILKL